MDREVLVDQMRRLERELRREFGPVALLMLVPPESWPDELWNLVVSAKRFNRLTRAEGISQVIDLMPGVLDRELWSRIIRVTVLRTDDPFVTGMTALHPTRSVVDLHALHVQGFEIAKAVLFEAEKVAA